MWSDWISHSVIIPLSFMKGGSGMGRKHTHLVVVGFVQLQCEFYACLHLFEYWCKSLCHSISL